MSWFMFTCVHITSVLILKSMPIVSCTIICANQIVLNLGLAEPDVLCLLASLRMCCTVHCAAVLKRSQASMLCVLYLTNHKLLP